MTGDALALLCVQDLSLRFGGVTALDRVSFDIAAGQIVGLIGPNGAGKTSLFNCISRLYQPSAGSIRLYQPSAGSIRLEQHELLKLQPHEVIRLGITRTFQNVALFSRMTVLDNVLVGDHYRIKAGVLASAVQLGSARRAERQAVERARAALEIVDMQPMAEAYAASLPFAFQKRVELARALVSEPRLLLLDEPAGGLNHTEVRELADLIKRIQAQYRLTLLLVEHHMNLVMTISDQVVVLSFGRKIAEGTPDVVRNNPAVIEAYLGTAGAAA